MSHAWFASAAFLLAGAIGCGGSDRLEIYPVDGTLTLGGKPFGPTLIHLIPKDATGRMVVGEVDQAGKITFTSYERGDGAPAGEYKVLAGMKLEAPPRPFPAIYRDSERSPLAVTVREEGENNLTIDMDPKAGPMVGAKASKAAERMRAAQGSLMDSPPAEE